MTNIYWPIYKNLEDEFNSIMFNIHIDDSQLDVYSSKISDLILRASADIESLSKELYVLHGGTKTGFIKYDEDAIKHLEGLWLLSKKVVIISSYNCFQSNRTILPFLKNETRTGSARLTYAWNNSYQNLKHDRANSLTFGSIKYLFEVMAALYILNLYYKDEIVDMEKDKNALNFSNSLGSSIFSLKIHSCKNVPADGSYNKEADFDECLYFVNATEETFEVYKEGIKEVNRKLKELTTNHMSKVIQEEIKKPGFVSNEDPKKSVEELVLKEKEKIGPKYMIEASRNSIKDIEQLKYIALMNKNQV